MKYPILEHTLNGLSQSEIANLMDISPATVSVRLHRERKEIINNTKVSDIQSELESCATAYDIKHKKSLWTYAMAKTSPNVTTLHKESTVKFVPNLKYDNRLPYPVIRDLIASVITDPRTLFDTAYELGKQANNGQ